MQYNNNWTIKKYQDEKSIKFLFFWGHHPSPDGNITKTCFSQWWIAPFIVDGITYPTAEHWMMAAKAQLFGDYEIRDKILDAGNPAEAKKLGRLVKGFVPDQWERHKYEIVVQGNLHKFEQHAELKAFLLNTQERVLVEASPVDPVWGIGMAADSPTVNNPLSWRGENLLGYALMEVRDKLRHT